ncbi:MAG: AIR synthase-related protein [Promethearchaeota archaeon]
MGPPSSRRYEELGVSSQKEDVHHALAGVSAGLFPDCFCKVVGDVAGDDRYCSVLHSDTAGTKATLAYLLYRETGDASVFRGVVQDALVMNLDDVYCAGLPGEVLVSNTLLRNKRLVPAEVVVEVVRAYEDLAREFSSLGVPVRTCGGETADVGDVVRTVDVGCTVFARIERGHVVRSGAVRPGDAIVGFASDGRTAYERGPYNSGIGCNGITLARHGTLVREYAERYPEILDPGLPADLAFRGKHRLDDPLPGTELTVGHALLSPTRTYAPLLRRVYEELPAGSVHAAYHLTGGGQTKCLKFGPGVHYVKDDPFDIPPIFELIQESSGTPWREMYQVFNAGHRLEVVCPADMAERVLEIAGSSKLRVPAKVVGRVEKLETPAGATAARDDAGGRPRNVLTLVTPKGTFRYH